MEFGIFEIFCSVSAAFSEDYKIPSAFFSSIRTGSKWENTLWMMFGFGLKRKFCHKTHSRVMLWILMIPVRSELRDARIFARMRYIKNICALWQHCLILLFMMLLCEWYRYVRVVHKCWKCHYEIYENFVTWMEIPCVRGYTYMQSETRERCLKCF